MGKVKNCCEVMGTGFEVENTRRCFVISPVVVDRKRIEPEKYECLINSKYKANCIPGSFDLLK